MFSKQRSFRSTQYCAQLALVSVSFPKLVGNNIIIDHRTRKMLRILIRQFLAIQVFNTYSFIVTSLKQNMFQVGRPDDNESKSQTLVCLLNSFLHVNNIVRWGLSVHDLCNAKSEIQQEKSQLVPVVRIISRFELTLPSSRTSDVFIKEGT